MKESLYAERKGYYPFLNNIKKIVLRAFLCSFSSYFLFMDASLIDMYKQLHLHAL